jgi:assimilatory nitrate reductase catalytic subunit
VLRKLYPGALHAEIHPADAAGLGIEPGRAVVVESRRGRARALAFVSPTVPRGHVFLPMHDEATNRLTLDAFDPYSRQPAYKACAVRVRPERSGDGIEGSATGPGVEKPGVFRDTGFLRARVPGPSRPQKPGV